LNFLYFIVTQDKEPYWMRSGDRGGMDLRTLFQ